MEIYAEEWRKALRYFKEADHMLNVTYSLLKDPKLLIGATDKLFLCLTSAITSLLCYERMLKNIPNFSNTFESKFNIFRRELAKKHKIKQDSINLIQSVREINLAHEKSLVEFRRQNSFVICNDRFDVTEVTAGQIKVYLLKTKQLVEEIDLIISRYPDLQI